jgi:hypothetical protein
MQIPPQQVLDLYPLWGGGRGEGGVVVRIVEVRSNKHKDKKENSNRNLRRPLACLR